MLVYPAAQSANLDERGTFQSQDGYIFAGTYDGSRELQGRIVSRPSCGSQFLRQMLAAKVDAYQWNWRLAYNADAALRLCAAWPTLKL
jgi:hypothetical protein